MIWYKWRYGDGLFGDAVEFCVIGGIFVIGDQTRGFVIGGVRTRSIAIGGVYTRSNAIRLKKPAVFSNRRISCEAKNKYSE